ncbi:hypothetical protein EH240_14310 [Mesorhizobium tamadayense]|uniref:Uncharacterized protein n=1 Tax=Mesorhizobium tamadayense TaxID=425306 RepID=A0A3P3FSF9_9HYPH|nr:hypothetical protein [Mesorhizobium tamadayense]RRI01484.1 hypothetical protein EH240_14310 [Mesorhizobium tamadayense]
MEVEHPNPPVPDPNDAALTQQRRVGDADAQHSASQDTGSWLKELSAEAHGHDMRLGLMDGPGPPSSASQPAQSTGLRRKRPLYFEDASLDREDASLISGFRDALIDGNAGKSTVRNNVSHLLSFGRWLFANKMDPIKDRLDKQSLRDNARELMRDPDPQRLLKAIDPLRTWWSTGAVPTVRRAKLNPPPQTCRSSIQMTRWSGCGSAMPLRSTARGRILAVGQRSFLRKATIRMWRLGLMDELGPSSSLEPAARHDRAPDAAGSDHQQSADGLMGALARSNLLPGEEVLINDEHDIAEVRPAKRQRILDTAQDVATERQLSGIASSGGRLLTPAFTHQLPWLRP